MALFTFSVRISISRNDLKLQMQTRSDSVQSFGFFLLFFCSGHKKKVTMEKDNTQGKPMCLLAGRRASHP